jgi:hypothetical protein
MPQLRMTTITHRGRPGGEHACAMSRKRIRKPLLAGGVIGLIAVAGTGPFVVRDLLAAFVLFCVLFCVLLGVLGIAVLGSFLLGEGVVRCFDLLVTSLSSFRLRQAIPSVVGPLTRGVGKS